MENEHLTSECLQNIDAKCESECLVKDNVCHKNRRSQQNADDLTEVEKEPLISGKNIITCTKTDDGGSKPESVTGRVKCTR